MFKGTYSLRIDSKGRMPVPAPFRRLLAEDETDRVIVTPLDQCLAVYTPAEWKRLEARLVALPAFSKPVKALTRLLASRASDCVLDRQGRILLPPALRVGAELARDALVIGALSRFEVWTPARWDAFVRDSESVLEDATLGVDWPLSDPVAVTKRPQAKPSR